MVCTGVYEKRFSLRRDRDRAGHAGCEAALASARMVDHLRLHMNLDTMPSMSCNLAIGGLAKGHWFGDRRPRWRNGEKYRQGGNTIQDA